MSRARPTAARSRRASSRDSRVVARARVAPSRARSRGVVSFYYFYALIYDVYIISYVHDPPSRHGSRVSSYTSHCVSTPVCPNSPPTTRRVESIARSARGDARDNRDASDAVRSSAIRADSRRERARASITGTPTVARRPRGDRDDAVAVPTERWIRGDADGRRRRDVDDAFRQWTRFEDSTSRAYTTRARERRDARARRRATEDPSRARGARGRARDDEGRRGEER